MFLQPLLSIYTMFDSGNHLAYLWWCLVPIAGQFWEGPTSLVAGGEDDLLQTLVNKESI